MKDVHEPSHGSRSELQPEFIFSNVCAVSNLLLLYKVYLNRWYSVTFVDLICYFGTQWSKEVLPRYTIVSLLSYAR